MLNVLFLETKTAPFKAVHFPLWGCPYFDDHGCMVIHYIEVGRTGYVSIWTDPMLFYNKYKWEGITNASWSHYAYARI